MSKLPLRQKYAARRAVRVEIEKGRMIKPTTCPKCGRKDVSPHNMQAHHRDYSKPLVVEWMCRWCHRVEHLGDMHAGVVRARDRRRGAVRRILGRHGLLANVDLERELLRFVGEERRRTPR